MPLQKRLAPEYHGTSSSASSPRILGKRQLLQRFSWISHHLLTRVSSGFPVAITEHWAEAAEASPVDPLLIQALPDPRELIPAGGDVPDPVADRAKSPVPWLVQKHPDRALLLERCASISSIFNHLSVVESQRLFGSQEPLYHTYQ